MTYAPSEGRYNSVPYRQCGQSGVMLPPISLGLWQNFGGVDVFETGRAIIRRAFDRGVTHFNLANMYGPRYGSALDPHGTFPKHFLSGENLNNVRSLIVLAGNVARHCPRWPLRGSCARVG